MPCLAKMNAREKDSGRWSDRWCLLLTFPELFRLVEAYSLFLTRISCRKTTHANSYYGAWPGWAVSVSVLPLTKGCCHRFSEPVAVLSCRASSFEKKIFFSLINSINALLFPVFLTFWIRVGTKSLSLKASVLYI